MRAFVYSFISIFLTSSIALAGPLDQSDLFQPDVYPSTKSAASGLAKRVVSILSASSEFDPATQSVQISHNGRTDLCEVVSTILTREFPPLKVEIAGERPAQSPQVVSINLRYTEEGSLPDLFRSHKDLKKGVLNLTLSGDAIVRETFDAGFIDKPWVADWTAFSNSEPKGRWIRGQSDDVATSDAEATASARKQAANALWPHVRERMNAHAAGRSGNISVKQRWVTAQIEALLRNEKYIADRFVQNFERPYGNFWRASILVDASSKNIDQMAIECSRRARAEFGQKAMTFGSLAALVAVIVLLYFLVNSLTRGYFMWRLRTMALLLSIVGILIVLAVR